MTRCYLAIGAVAALSACSAPSNSDASADTASVGVGNSVSQSADPAQDGFDGTAMGTLPSPSSPDAAVRPSDHVGDPPAPITAVDPGAQRIAIAEWRNAGRKPGCSPLALKSDAGARGTARRANFSGGWGVAFDLPGVRSAYGLAGTGFIPPNAADAQVQRTRLTRQWPYFRDLRHLPQPSFAGFGREGAEPYSDRNPDGNGLNSIAYVSVLRLQRLEQAGARSP